MSILGKRKKQPELKTKNCPDCEGKGYIICDECNGEGRYYPYTSISYCDHCKGKGKYTCMTCRGFGWIRAD